MCEENHHRALCSCDLHTDMHQTSHKPCKAHPLGPQRSPAHRPTYRLTPARAPGHAPQVRLWDVYTSHLLHVLRSSEGSRSLTLSFART